MFKQAASSLMTNLKFVSEVLRRACAQEGDPHHNVMTRLHRKLQTSTQGFAGYSTSNCAYDAFCFGKVLLELVTRKLGLSNSEDFSTREWLDHTLLYISSDNKEFVTKIMDPSLIIDKDLLKEDYVKGRRHVSLSRLRQEPLGWVGSVSPPFAGPEDSAVSGCKQSGDASFNIILGSASGARRQVLDNMGYEFTVVIADIDEKAIRKDDPEDLVMALAEAKAEAISQGLLCSGHNADDKPTLLITCDQVVVYEGVIREKPSSMEEAREFLKDYSGGHAATVSSVLVTNLKTGTRKGGIDRVEIHFNEITDKIIEAMIAEGIVLKSAGGLIIKHPSIVPYVKRMVGTTDSVLGLPKDLTKKLIKNAL